MSVEMKVAPGITKIAPGYIVIVNQNQVEVGSAGPVANHETDHALAGYLTGSTDLEASINPGPGYLGITRFGEFNAIAAAAAHSMGRSGAGYDVALVARMGHDVGSAGSAARSILENNMHIHAAVAWRLQQRRVITGADIADIINKVENPDAEVIVITPFGKEKHYVSKTHGANGYIIPLEIAPEKPAEVETKTENPNNWPKHEVGEVDVPLYDHILNYQTKRIRSAPSRLETLTR